MKLALTPYLNMRPFTMVAPPPGWRVLPLTPRQALSALARGEVSAAVVPVGGLDRLTGVAEPLGPFGIASSGPVRSVLFLSALPFADLHSGHGLRLTGESVTSVRLLYLLLGYGVGFHNLPHLAHPGEEHHGELLIGDAALRHRGAPYVTDLAEEWHARHGLPFVFARWLVGVGVPEEQRRVLRDWIDQVVLGKGELVSRLAAGESGFAPDLVAPYLRNIRYRLSEEDGRSEAIFHQELARLGRQPLFAGGVP